jgi:uncharacterized OB-fold protein
MATMASERVPQAPQESPDNKAFWDAARAGRLLVARCNDTGRFFMYPRRVSPFTLSGNVEMVEARGTGEIYSYSIARGKEPFCVAYVKLDEGPIMLSNIVDADLDALACGQRVRVVFKASENGGAPVPMFTPA